MVKMVSNNGVPRLRALALRDYSFNNLILTVSPPPISKPRRKVTSNVRLGSSELV